MDHLFWYPGHDLSLPDIVRADNCRLYDTSGKSYLDLESGVWCTCIGHGRPEILTTITEQAAALAHTGFGFAAPRVNAAAGDVLALHGMDGGRAVFLCSGSEAVEFGIRVARDALGDLRCLTMADSYFGAYGAAKDKDRWTLFDWHPCRDCERSECDDKCTHWAAVPIHQINFFVFEPGSAGGLVGFPPVQLVRSIMDTIRNNGGLVMVNEVTTGMGRTARWFGYEHYGIRPDITAMGKGLGNGYPVSATAVSETVCGMLPDSTIAYAQSHQNDPLGAAVAATVIRVIRENGLIERAGRLSEKLFTGLDRVGAATGRIKEIRGRGLMVAVELNGDPETTAKVRQALLDNGFVVAQRPGLSVLRLDPALTISREDLEGFIRTLEAVLKTV